MTCPDCGFPVTVKPSMAMVEIVLQDAGPKDVENVFVVDGNVAIFKSKASIDERRYLPHRPKCKPR